MWQTRRYECRRQKEWRTLQNNPVALPDYWLSRPKFLLTREVKENLEHLFTQHIATGEGGMLTTLLPVPKWVFLCWLTDCKGLLLHGSGNPDITMFEPRKPNDSSPDDFSKREAVFAASDGIWPIFYAVIDRQNHRLRMLNGALQFALEPGRYSPMRYYFSVTASVLKQAPWREGVVYVLPRRLRAAAALRISGPAGARATLG